MTTVRTARLSDAKELAVLAEVTFRETFAEQNTPEDMKVHCESTYSEAIQAKEISSPEYTTLIAEDNDKLIAYAQLRWGKAPKCVEAKSPGEIQRLYVAKAWHGRGLAQRLMQACLNEMRKRNTDFAWLGVWEENPRAIAFYKKFNFQQVGEHVFLLGKDPQRDIILMLSLLEDEENS